LRKYLLPLAVFVLVAIFLWRGLFLNPREVPSPLIGKSIPEFSLPKLEKENSVVTSKTFDGTVWVLNVFASWCTPCLDEHPMLMELASQNRVIVVGLNYKDGFQNAADWLGKHGNPYSAVAVDTDGLVGLDFGVYGVPETFLIDKSGVIRYKKIGPLSSADIQDELLPLVESLQ
jgi:cytochrome c biogenesis protein CcmG/thiol:disulfide interchange protein DsbE